MAESGRLTRGRSMSSTHTELSSSLLGLLRSSVNNRFPRLASLSRSAVNIHKRAISGSRTPPPAYSIIRHSSDLQEVNSDSDSITSGQDDLSEGGRSISSSIDQLTPTETNTGIIWSYANQGTETNASRNNHQADTLIGIKLLKIATEQSATERLDDSASVIGRSLYIHALTYLLRGLPTDLSLEEQLSIRAALPAGINTPLNIEVNEQQLASNPTPDTTSQCTSSPSILHRFLATGIVYLFFFVHFMLPYIKLWIKSAYQYDREHHITERLVSSGISTADGVAKTSIEMYGAVSKMGDGKVGQAVDSAAAWCLAGVAGGIHEGVGEGLVIIGARRSAVGSDRSR